MNTVLNDWAPSDKQILYLYEERNNLAHLLLRYPHKEILMKCWLNTNYSISTEKLQCIITVRKQFGLYSFSRMNILKAMTHHVYPDNSVGCACKWHIQICHVGFLIGSPIEGSWQQWMAKRSHNKTCWQRVMRGTWCLLCLIVSPIIQHHISALLRLIFPVLKVQSLDLSLLKVQPNSDIHQYQPISGH